MVAKSPDGATTECPVLIAHLRGGGKPVGYGKPGHQRRVLEPAMVEAQVALADRFTPVRAAWTWIEENFDCI